MFYQILIFIFGLAVGSFINALVYRLHEGKSLLKRSECPNCRHKIAWYDNIPLLSFFILRGKCRHCRAKISWQYPLVELTTGILFVVAYLNVFGSSLYPLPEITNSKFQITNFIELLGNFLFIAILIVIFIYDLRWYLILDIITIPAIVLAFFINLLLGFNWENLLIGGIIGGSFFLLQFLLSRGKWVGGGDIRLGFLMGVMLGYKLLAVALFIAYILGAIVGIIFILSGKKKLSSKIPFGTFLSAATIISIFFGERILRWYFDLIF